MKKVLLALVLVVVATVPSAQGTPRGQGPALRDACFDPFEWEGTERAGFKACEKIAGCEICAAESGTALGLCTAYCSAMECDEAEPAASETACLKVKLKYIEVTGNAELPCDGGAPEGVTCGSYVSCIECLWGTEPWCGDCADDLRTFGGCTNVCNP